MGEECGFLTLGVLPGSLLIKEETCSKDRCIEGLRDGVMQGCGGWGMKSEWKVLLDYAKCIIESYEIIKAWVD